MHINGPTTLRKLGVLALSTMMLIGFLVPLGSSEADASGPCPWYGIQDVFDDPHGNWDGDGVNNGDELYNGLNPCIVDTANFCGGGGNPLCTYHTYTYVSSPCQIALTSNPNGDFDGDGVSNIQEHRNYADPCSRPCPGATNADLALNPNGDWDHDGVSNAVEVNRRTNPCTTPVYRICPHYSHYDVSASPHGDWDGDGISNAVEVRRGYNPCQFTTVHVTVAPAPTTRLPHVAAPKPPPPPPRPVAICPAGYPYYHLGNGLCYANPVGPQRWH